jgi:hypothetical protein
MLAEMGSNRLRALWWDEERGFLCSSRTVYFFKINFLIFLYYSDVLKSEIKCKK